MTNPLLRKIALKLTGKARLIEKWTDTWIKVQNPMGVCYHGVGDYLDFKGYRQGYRVEMLRGIDHKGTIFIHELFHWMHLSGAFDEYVSGFSNYFQEHISKLRLKMEELSLTPDKQLTEDIVFLVDRDVTMQVIQSLATLKNLRWYNIK